MENKRKGKRVLIVAMLFTIILLVSAIVGMIFYFNGVLNDRNSKIALLNKEIAKLNDEISNLNSEISNLTSQITNLTTANLVTALGIKDLQNSEWPSYYYLDIDGSVINTGEGTAYNVGLHVVAYNAQGILEINMTVPLEDYGVFYADNKTEALLSSHIGASGQIIGTVYTNQTAAILVDIYHQGVVSNWTVTPVWTNSP